MKILFITLSLILNVLAFENNVTETNEGRIIDGEKAGYGQFPWQVSLHFDDGVLCGGGLVGKQYVLTAAHCVHGRQGGGTVKLGALNRDDPNAKQIRMRYWVYGGYNPPSLSNDIAVIRMEESVEEQANIRVIPINNNYVTGGSYVFLSGYGADKDQGSTNSDLNYVLLQAITNEQCLERNGGSVDDGMLCAQGEGKKNLCSGDSGSPLIQQVDGVWKLVGIASYSVGGCESGHPGGYARVSHYLSFIYNEINKD